MKLTVQFPWMTRGWSWGLRSHPQAWFVGLSHVLSPGAGLRRRTWRARSGLLEGDTDKSPLLATSCPHSCGRPAGVVCGAGSLGCRGPGAPWATRRTRAAELLPPFAHCALAASLSPHPGAREGHSARAAETLTSDLHIPASCLSKTNTAGTSLPGAQSLVRKTESQQTPGNKATQVI